MEQHPLHLHSHEVYILSDNQSTIRIQIKGNIVNKLGGFLAGYLNPIFHQKHRTWQPSKQSVNNRPIFKTLNNDFFHLMTIRLMENLQKKSTSCACLINKINNSTF